MKRNRTMMLAVIALVMSAAGALAADTVTVVEVPDVRTIITSTGEKITLLGIGPPKSKYVSQEDARDYLETMLMGQRVRLEPDPAIERKRYRETLRYVWVDNFLVNMKLVEEGYAVALRSPRHERRNEMLAAEESAREQKIGLWAAGRLPAERP